MRRDLAHNVLSAVVFGDGGYELRGEGVVVYDLRYGMKHVYAGIVHMAEQGEEVAFELRVQSYIVFKQYVAGERQTDGAAVIGQL